MSSFYIDAANFLSELSEESNRVTGSKELEEKCNLFLSDIDKQRKLLDGIERSVKLYLTLLEAQRIREKLEKGKKELENISDPAEREAKAEVFNNQAIEKYREMMKNYPKQESFK